MIPSRSCCCCGLIPTVGFGRSGGGRSEWPRGAVSPPRSARAHAQVASHNSDPCPATLPPNLTRQARPPNCSSGIETTAQFLAVHINITDKLSTAFITVNTNPCLDYFCQAAHPAIGRSVTNCEHDDEVSGTGADLR